MIGVKGKQLCAGNPNAAGQTDGRTDMVIPVYAPNFVAEGIKIQRRVHFYANQCAVVKSIWYFAIKTKENCPGKKFLSKSTMTLT